MPKRITVQGLVQGVGFRPFVCRLAREMGLSGSVANRNDGVLINLDAGDAECGVFVRRLARECPPVATIHRVSVSENGGAGAVAARDFVIVPSQPESDELEITQVAPDIAVCGDCLRDRETQPHRLQYPFINCTHCGPRFTIVKDLPYDRARTTMAAFAMCETCRREYDDMGDRRFHAQPVACNHCGPVYHADHDGGRITDYPRLLALTTRLLDDGGIIAVKGTGGYHLACDAANESAVRRLREIKRRDSKPFAVMFRDEHSLAPHVAPGPEERACLVSWRRPVVLLRQRAPLAPSVNPRMSTLGVLLAYMPLHHDWFARLRTPALVMTSGNLTDEPIAISEADAVAQFGGKVDLLLHHNREIHNRADDSVAQICGTKTCVIRRSRGYAPEPFFTDTTTEGTLAFGAEMTGAFALGRGSSVIMSQHLGDLKNWETFQFYEEALARFQRLFRFTPRQLVCDLHPDYLSTRAAENMAAEKKLPLLRVQHHHAHAAACMLEHRLHEPLIAVVWDAVGLGGDGGNWGGEFFLCDRKHHTRLAHLDCVPMPGGDKTALEPWRMALAWLRHYDLPLPEEFATRLGAGKINAITAMINRRVNSPLTSSAGRLFDALASLTGVCDTATRQAEAPILLEQCAADDFSSRYDIGPASDGASIALRELFAAVLDDKRRRTAVEIISAKIHNTLAALIVEKIAQLRAATGAREALATGGCFQNKRLLESVQTLCAAAAIPLHVPEALPCNDSGLAAGQLAIATANQTQNK